jgi:multiple sugar transport system ATP-binding protein
MAEIRVENLRKSFDQFTAVQGSNFTIPDGSFFAMLGPSGCGKTTTLRMIAGLELPTDGRVLLDGEDVTFRRAAARDIAFVFQLFALYPHMNVAENIAFPLKCAGMTRAEIRARVSETARLLRIEHLLSSKTSKLSGGDRQRVALGRAMVRRPKAFLMDEPLGALDAEFRHLMCSELRDLHDRIRATTIYVTHDQLEAMTLADILVVMNGGQVEQIGNPLEIYQKPATTFVAAFIGAPPMNLIKLDDKAIMAQLGTSPALADAGILGIRPEHFEVTDNAPAGGVTLDLTVEAIEHVGAETYVYGTRRRGGDDDTLNLATTAGDIIVRVPGEAAPGIGTQIRASAPPEKLHLFSADGRRRIKL